MRALFLPNKNISRITQFPASSAWENLYGKTIKNKTIVLDQFGDIHPCSNGPIFTATDLFMLNCNKNFVYYWMNSYTFPNISTIYLASHPCEIQVFYRQFNKIYLHENYCSYKNRWAANLDNVHIITDQDLKLELLKYDGEEIIFE